MLLIDVILKKGFDIYGLDQNAKEDQKGILEASKDRKDNFLFNNYFYSIFVVNDLIEEEINNGISSKRVVREARSISFYNFSFSILDHRWFFTVSCYKIFVFL
jgi:hypothetical protein